LGAFWSLADQRAHGREPPAEARSPLRGFPLAVKDSFDLAGLPTTGGLRGPHAAAGGDAEAVQLLERAGAVAIGKTAMDPLAWTTHGQAEGFPPCLNPIDRSLSPGGSSSGSAVAVAAGIVPLALGTDTAGSIRIPAAYCGVVGLKPAFDAVSLEGCLPLAVSFDTVGLLANTVGRCAAAYDALVGGDAASSAAASPEPDGPIGVISDMFDAAEPEIAAVCRRAADAAKVAGVQIEDVRLGFSAPGLGLLLAFEFAAAWGVQVAADPGRFPTAIVEAIERARTISEERYARARAELDATRARLRLRLERFSALLAPTVPVPVPALEREDVAVSTRFTRIFSALGWPALSVPCGWDSRSGPVGMQIATAGPVEHAVAVAAIVERATGQVIKGGASA
jgi:aspartyl-tRNA(Asn)/glutamyl-tRNA(Gln) amidotransferase subunit A